MEVVRRRAMVGTVGTNPLAAIPAILRDEGVAGLYKGYGVNVVKVAPSSAITFCVYEAMRKGNHQEAVAQLIANMRAKQQVALDSGDWTNAWLLTGLQDRTERAKWAGTPTDMSAIAAYRKADKELRLRLGDAKPPNVSDDDDDHETKEKRKAAAKAKAEAKAKKKEDEKRKKANGDQ